MKKLMLSAGALALIAGAAGLLEQEIGVHQRELEAAAVRVLDVDLLVVRAKAAVVQALAQARHPLSHVVSGARKRTRCEPTQRQH